MNAITEGVDRSHGSYEPHRTYAEIVEDALDELALPWKRRDGGWVVPAGAHRPREVAITHSPGELHLEAELCSWDSLGATEKHALALVFERASLGSARCQVGETRATVGATLSEQATGAELRAAIKSVLAGSRALGRDATALLVPALAGEVVRFFCDEREMSDSAERI